MYFHSSGFRFQKISENGWRGKNYSCYGLAPYFAGPRALEKLPDLSYLYTMKSWGRFALLFFAYSIALLHTAVPHHHTQARTGEFVISHSACVFSEAGGGFLQKVLSTDLGIGHLENFKKGGETDLNLSAAVSWVIATAVLYVALHNPANAASEFSKGHIEKLKRKLLLFSVSHFRAPPVS